MTMVIEDSQTGSGIVSAVLPTMPEAASFISIGHPMIGIWSAIRRLESLSLPDSDFEPDASKSAPGGNPTDSPARN